MKRFYKHFYKGAERRKKLKKLTNKFFISREQERLRDISELMKNVTQCFTNWYNNKHKRQGALFSGRFQSRLLPNLIGYVRNLKRALNVGDEAFFDITDLVYLEFIYL